MIHPSAATQSASAWLLTYFLHSSVLLGAALLARRWSLASRREELVLRVAFFAPLLTATLPMLGAEIAPALRLATVGSDGAGITPSRDVPEAVARVAIWALLVVPIAAFAAGAFRLLRCMVRESHYLRTLEPRTPVRDARLRRWVGVFTASDVRLTRSDRVRAPIALGDEICLPTRALWELSAPELRAVLAHEVAHLERRDYRWAWAVLVVERLMAIQPLNRVARRELRSLAEQACDDWAVAATRDPDALASALTKVASWLQSAMPRAVPALAADGTLALLRLRRILARRELPAATPPPGRRVGALPALAVLALALPMMPRVELGAARDARDVAERMTIHATDPAGAFTVTIDEDRVVAVTMDGAPVPPAHVRQRGRRLTVAYPTSGPTLDLTLTGSGITWKPRRAAGALPRPTLAGHR